MIDAPRKIYGWHCKGCGEDVNAEAQPNHACPKCNGTAWESLDVDPSAFRRFAAVDDWLLQQLAVEHKAWHRAIEISGKQCPWRIAEHLLDQLARVGVVEGRDTVGGRKYRLTEQGRQYIAGQASVEDQDE